MADNTIFINTKLDFDADTQTLSVVEDSINGIKKSVHELNGTKIQFSDPETIRKIMEETSKKVDELTKKREIKLSLISDVDEKLDDITRNIEQKKARLNQALQINDNDKAKKLTKDIQSLENKYEELKDKGQRAGQTLIEIENQLEQKTKGLTSLTQQYKDAVAETPTDNNMHSRALIDYYNEANSVDLLTRRLQFLEDTRARMYQEGADEQKILAITTQIDNLRNRIDKMNSSIDQTSSSVRNAGNESNKTTEAISKLSDRFGGLTKRVFIFSAYVIVLRSLRKWFTEVVKTSEELTEALGQLKAAALILIQPLLYVVIPALTKIIKVLSTILYYAAKAISYIFGIPFNKMVSDAQSLYDSTAGTSKSLKDATKNAKEFKRQLASFDNLEILERPDDDETDPLDSLKASDTIQPNWNFADMMKAEFLKLAFLTATGMIVAGLLLIFSGASIPVGLMLLFLGALSMYGMIREHWGEIKELLQENLTAFVFAGVALVVIGILCIAGGNVGLGIGCIIAGAGILAMEITANWDELSSLLSGPIGDAVEIVSGALLVLGIICICGGAIPLGIGLIIMGCAGIAITGYARWSTDPLTSMINEVREEQRKLRNEFEAGNKQYETNVGTLEANADAAKGLADELEVLVDKYDFTAKKSAEIQGIVDEINRLVPGLGLMWDATTGELSMNTQAIKDNIDALTLQAQAEEAGEHYKELQGQKREADKLLEEAENNLTEFKKKWGLEDVSNEELMDWMNKTDYEIASFARSHGGDVNTHFLTFLDLFDNKDSFDLKSQMMAAVNSWSEAKKTQDDIATEISETTTEWRDKLKESGKAIDKAGDDYVGAAQKTTEVINEGMEEANENLQNTGFDNTESLFYDEYGNIAEAGADGYKDHSGAIIDNIEDTTEGAAVAVQDMPEEMANAIDESSGEVSKSVQSFTSDVSDALTEAFSDGGPLQQRMMNFWSTMHNIFTTAIQGIEDDLHTSIGNMITDINNLLGAVNTANVQVKNVGTSSYIPMKIPGYASGTVVPPNSLRLAYLGDNKTETEVVSPVSTMKQAFIEAMREMGGIGGGEFKLYLDSKPIAARVEQIHRQNNRAYGV